MSWRTDWIKIRGLCGDTTSPGSGLYIDDLPDMGRWRFEALGDPSAPSFGDVWERVYARALRNMGDDIRANMPQALQASNVLQNVVFGRYKQDYEAYTGTGRFSGVLVRVEGSQYLDLYLNSVSVWLDQAADVPVRVFDAKTGQALYSQTFTGAQYHNTFQINQNFTTAGQWKELFICYDDTAKVSFQSDADYVPYSTNFDHYQKARGASVSTGSSPIEANMSFDGYTGGFVANWNLHCSMDAFICQHRHPLSNAALYKCAVELLAEVLGNDTAINRYTLTPRETLEKRGAEFEEKYMSALGAVMGSIHPAVDDVCIHCNPAVSWRINAPIRRSLYDWRLNDV